MSLGPFARQAVLGGRDISVGAAWTTYTSADFTGLTTGAALAAGLPCIRLTVRNTHAAQTLFVTLYAAGAAATTHTIPIGPGGSYTLDLTATQPTSISFQGSGAATTGHATGWFRVGGGGG